MTLTTLSADQTTAKRVNYDRPDSDFQHHDPFSGLIRLATARSQAWFQAPARTALIDPQTRRQVRSERREACETVLIFFLQNLDPLTLRVGRAVPGQGFEDLSMPGLAAGTGLGLRRCERAVAMLRQAGIIEVTPPRFQKGGGKHVGLRASRRISESFFRQLGLERLLSAARELASTMSQARR